MEIAFAVIGVTDVAVRAASKLWALSTAWRDAPTDLHSLRDDLTCTERFFSEVQQHLKTVPQSRMSSPVRIRGFTFEGKDTSISPSPASDGYDVELLTMGGQSELGRLVEQGGVALRRVEAIVDGLIGTVEVDAETQSVVEKVGELGKRRKFLWLRQSRKLAKLRKELGHVRSSICRALIAQNISVSSEIFNTLEQSQQEVASQLSNISMSIDASQDTLVAQLDGRLQGIEDRMLAAIHQTPSPTEKPLRPKDPFTPYEPAPPYSKADYPLSQRLRPCPCPCPCHQTTASTYHLTLLRSLIGILAIAHTTRQTTPCTNPLCLSHPPNPKFTHDLYLTYHLPPWLARTTITVFLTTTPTPALNLRLYNRRPLEETQAPMGAARLIEKGDIPALKGELAAGRISIYDVHATRGHTALTVAVTANRPEVVRLYLQAGADPFYVDDYGDMVITQAFMLALSGVRGDKEMGELFPIGRYVEEAGFTELQRAVLVGVEVGGMLGKSKGKIEDRRGDGWTALHLAAIKGDVGAVRALVRAGADVDALTGKHRVTPLYYACRYGHEEVVRVLLGSGADVNLRDCYGRQPIHASVGPGSRLGIVELLSRHGADVNSPGMLDYPPLMYAVLWGPMETVIVLLDKGADIAGRSIHGCTMLMMAVRLLRHEKARLLLARSGADLLASPEASNRTLLHFLATGGDEEMLDIFCGTKKWKGVSVLAKDKLGSTPLYLLNQRNTSKGLREAFDRLLDWVERCNDDDDGHDSDDEFFDAEDSNEATGNLNTPKEKAEAD